MGASLLRSEVYTREGPEGPGALPVEHVQARLHGVNVFGFPARRIDVDPLLGEHLQSEDQRIANLQIVAGSYFTLIFEFFFSVSWVDLSFDVVEIPED
jgi:hypothetical protein